MDRALPLRRGRRWLERSTHEITIYEPNGDSLHVLNPTAFAIWELCDGETSPSEMSAAIVELTGISPEEADRDVSDTLAQLAERDLVVFPKD